jgi:transcriptional regulator GlxA family with amidase domain
MGKSLFALVAVFVLVAVNTARAATDPNIGRTAGTPAARAETADLLMVPARAARHPAEVLDHGIGDHSLPVRTLIARTRDQGTAIASACAGTFLLAEAGILDGVSATTTWWLSPAFRSRYPKVQLDDGRMVIASDGITTAGAAFGHVDLALAIVRTSTPQWPTW